MDGMVYIPGGEFLLGSPSWALDWLEEQRQTFPREWFADETPQVLTRVPPYWIDCYPVTVAQFEQFVVSTGYVTDAERRGFGMVYTDYWDELPGVDWRHPGGTKTVEGYGDHPVVHVSWDDANAYAAWVGKRLTTEAEWELAARGYEYRLWPWGNSWHDNYANTAELHARGLGSLEAWRRWWYGIYSKMGPVPQTTAVGSFDRVGSSEFDVCDMAGNVYEWTATLSALYYPSVACDPLLQVAMGKYRVIRGGSWMNFRYQVRCAERMHGDPSGWSNFALGFRCAKSA